LLASFEFSIADLGKFESASTFMARHNHSRQFAFFLKIKLQPTFFQAI